MRRDDLFADLFVLEVANNHYGRRARGLKIVHDFGAVVRANGVKAAIKLQFRDVDQFVHPDFKGNTNIRYICKTESTKPFAGRFRGSRRSGEGGRLPADGNPLRRKVRRSMRRLRHADHQDREF